MEICIGCGRLLLELDDGVAWAGEGRKGEGEGEEGI
jgi:predicted Fe-S protein YdhL (DUF1289 family)